MPILFCRQAHHITYYMAKHLGFFVVIFDLVEAAQPIQPHWTVEPERLQEVREELGYVFAHTEGPIPHLVRQFERVIPQQALGTSTRWAETAPSLAPHYTALRGSSLTGNDRERAMDRLYIAATQIFEPTRPWRRVRSGITPVLSPAPF